MLDATHRVAGFCSLQDATFHAPLQSGSGRRLSAASRAQPPLSPRTWLQRASATPPAQPAPKKVLPSRYNDRQASGPASTHNTDSPQPSYAERQAEKKRLDREGLPQAEAAAPAAPSSSSKASQQTPPPVSAVNARSRAVKTGQSAATTQPRPLLEPPAPPPPDPVLQESRVVQDTAQHHPPVHNKGVRQTSSLFSSLDSKAYKLPSVKGERTLSEKALEWFAGRGISETTLTAARIFSEVKYDAAGAAQDVICYPFYRGGKLVNIKYRKLGPTKAFWQTAGAEKVVYGYDDVATAQLAPTTTRNENSTTVIIVEGEMDKLAFYEAGILNVVSVPEGAGAARPVGPDEKINPETDSKFSYIYTDIFEKATCFILATDNDKPGQALAADLALRLGREKCRTVTWPARTPVARPTAPVVEVVESSAAPFAGATGGARWEGASSHSETRDAEYVALPVSSSSDAVPGAAAAGAATGLAGSTGSSHGAGSAQAPQHRPEELNDPERQPSSPGGQGWEDGEQHTAAAAGAAAAADAEAHDGDGVARDPDEEEEEVEAEEDEEQGWGAPGAAQATAPSAARDGREEEEEEEEEGGEGEDDGEEAAPAPASHAEECKDANEVLVAFGADALHDMVARAKPLSINGLVTFTDFETDIWKYYNRSSEEQRGTSTGWKDVDEYYTIMPGELTIITGIPNSGKSEWIDALTMNLAQAHNWAFAVCALEKTPVIQARQLLEKLVKQPFFNDTHAGRARMDRDSLQRGMEWLNQHYVPIYKEEGTPTIDWVLERAKIAVTRHGVRGLVIDPYNELDHERPKFMQETEFISGMLSKIKRFAQANDCHVWFVAHPRQLQNFKGEPPTLYDISGSAHFVNKADNAIVIHRTWNSPARQQQQQLAGGPQQPAVGGGPEDVRILVRKVRNKAAGKQGEAVLKYDRPTGCYRNATDERDTTTDVQPEVFDSDMVDDSDWDDHEDDYKAGDATDAASGADSHAEDIDDASLATPATHADEEEQETVEAEMDADEEAGDGRFEPRPGESQAECDKRLDEALQRDRLHTASMRREEADAERKLAAGPGGLSIGQGALGDEYEDRTKAKATEAYIDVDAWC